VRRGYGDAVIAVVLTLSLLAVAAMVAARSAGRVETAAKALSGIDPTLCQQRADDLRSCADTVRDAVAERAPR